LSVRFRRSIFHTLVVMLTRFESATSVHPKGDGVYTASIADGWDIMGNANGGYLIALAANAMRHAAGREDPLSITAHYLAPAPAGDVQIRTEVVKSGRRVATVAASLRRDDREFIRVLGSFGTLQNGSGSHHVTMTPPDLPPIEECILREPATGVFVPAIFDKANIRLHPDDAQFTAESGSGVAQMRGWFQFADTATCDSLGLLFVADAFPPTFFNLYGVKGWVPTLEYTVHVRARPVDGPLRCVFTTRALQGGFMEEDGEMWDESGTLVAMSRQLALVPLGQ
jgi:acyl-CoA thioesterase